jgi:phospholipase C
MRLPSALAAASLLLALTATATASPIKYVIVLMLENRSFDHMLGFLKQLNQQIRGCLPNDEGCSNHLKANDSTTAEVTVDDTAVYSQASPSHSISGTSEQIYGTSTPSDGATGTMDGFIQSYSKSFSGDTEKGSSIMHCYAPDHVPAIANLSLEFGLFDGWFASVPGPTMVNRAYAASSTSHGMGTNDELTIAKGLPQKTMFRQLLEMGLDYRVYFQQVPTLVQFKDMRHKDARPKYHKYEQLLADLQSGDMPPFSWVEPSYFSTTNRAATDQHPDHDVSLGDALIKEIYEALRASPIWEESAFLITYDEHGGFFDHVVPPTNVPNPDGLNSTDDPFDFTRLGVRVPAVIVSPWVAKGTVLHASDEESGSSSSAPSQYEHSSIISTFVHKIFQPAAGYKAPEYLTNRDAWAKSFDSIFTTLPEAREDCPLTLPPIVSHDQLVPGLIPAQDGTLPLTDLQMEILAIMAGVIDDQSLTPEIVSKWTELQGAEYATKAMEIFLASSD